MIHTGILSEMFTDMLTHPWAPSYRRIIMDFMEETGLLETKIYRQYYDTLERSIASLGTGITTLPGILPCEESIRVNNGSIVLVAEVHMKWTRIHDCIETDVPQMGNILMFALTHKIKNKKKRKLYDLGSLEVLSLPTSSMGQDVLPRNVTQPLYSTMFAFQQQVLRLHGTSQDGAATFFNGYFDANGTFQPKFSMR